MLVKWVGNTTNYASKYKEEELRKSAFDKGLCMLITLTAEETETR